MIHLEARTTPAIWMQWGSPILAIFLTILAGGGLMALLGKPPLEALQIYFLSPFQDSYSRAELIVKAVPLAMIGAGLAVCFRANIWNIGAAGQYILGAIFAGYAALFMPTGWWSLPLCLIMGVLGGALWAAIPALLRIRLGVNEILVSLMLVYIAEQLLDYLVRGPWRSPYAFGFPKTESFPDTAIMPILQEATRLHFGVILVLFVVLVLSIMMNKGVYGFALQLHGQSSRAATFAGFAASGGVWGGLLISGALAGLTGAIEVTATLQKLQPDISANYGFAAIIVAFLGRLNPIGAIFAALILAVSYIGGENAQILLKLPKNVTGLFQGMLLFFLLACDTLIAYRFVWKTSTAYSQTVHINAGQPSERPQLEKGTL